MDSTGKEETLRWFRGARFGIFIHWDPRVLTVPRYGHSYREEVATVDRIHDLYHYWNPVEFDASEWVGAFKQAGARYVTFTTKHQFGFCNFENPDTDYNVMNSPFGRDVSRKISDACHADDMPLMWYYSTEGGDINEGEYGPHDGLTYEEYRHNSVRRLLTKYGRVEGLWWDGGGDSTPDFMEMVRATQPHVITSGRLRVNGGKFDGDFTTPEQVVGAFDMDKTWESCVCLEGNEWFYCGGRDNKDAVTCIRTLIQCACGDGNLLLNVSPLPDGALQQEQVDVLRAMGAWLGAYGDSIYETRGGPYRPGAWGGSTRRGDRVFLHLTRRDKTGVFTLPPLPMTILSSRVLTEGEVIVTQNDEGVELRLDDLSANPAISALVELTLDGDAMDIDPIEVEDRVSLTRDCDVSASSQVDDGSPPNAVVEHSDFLQALKTTNRPKPEDFDLPYTFHWRERGFKWRHWIAADSDELPWIEVDFGRAVSFSEIQLLERHNRVRAFELQAMIDGEWSQLFETQKMNFFSYRFPPVTASKVRLVVLRTQAGAPGLMLFDVFE